MSKNGAHPNKEIEEALKYAKSQNWIVSKNKGHAWGNIKCPYNSKECRCGKFCIISIWSTPKNPQNHAKMIKDKVNGCTGKTLED